MHTPHKKHTVLLTILVALSLCFGGFLLTGCASEKVQIATFEQLAGKRIGYVTGSINATIAKELAGATGKTYGYNSTIDEFIALQSGKIDAVVDDEPCSRYIAHNKEGMVILDGYAQPINYGAIFHKDSATTAHIRQQLSEFIKTMKQNGTLAKIQDLWFNGEESDQVVDMSGLTGTSGTLKVAVSSVSGAPMAYIKNGELCGMDIDIIYRFARAYGYNLEFADSDFGGCLAAVASGKCDLAISGVSITDERKSSYDFSEPYYEGGVVVTVNDVAAAGSTGSLEDLLTSFKRTFIDQARWQLFVEGMAITLLITLLSLILGTALGFVLYMWCKNGGRIRNKIVDACVWLISGMPIVVLLMVMFYIIFAALDIDALVVAIIAFTLVFACSMLGMLRVGVNAVDKGQEEAARAMGYSELSGFFKIILPQALVHILPTYSSEAIGLLKGTAVVGYISVQDLTKIGDVVRSATYEAFFPIIAVAIVYFILEALLKFLIGLVQKRVDTHNRTEDEVLRGCTLDENVLMEISKNAGSTREIEIRLEHVGKDFGPVAPLLDVNATIHKGDVIVAVGPSGCGKSTLLRAMNLLDGPTSGSIFIDDDEITKSGYDATKVACRMGMVFQRWNLFGHWTVVENIMMPQVHILHRSRQQAYNYAMKLLAQVDLANKALSYPDELSGGQQQRVAIARTLGMDPDAILFDEPTSALDPGMVGEVQAVITQLARKGRTMLIVTHDMLFARQVSNRVFYMDEGGIYEDGTPEQVFDNPITEKARRFMLRLAKVSMEYKNGQFSMEAVQETLDNFCLRNRIPARCCMLMQLAAEETCANILPQMLPKETAIRIDFECSALRKEGTVSVHYMGPRVDLRDAEDQLALKMLQGYIKCIDYETVDNAGEQALDESSRCGEGVDYTNTITLSFDAK